MDTADPLPTPTPPLLPPRSHLRNGSAYQLKLRTMRTDVERPSSTTISSPVSQGFLEEIDRELTDTQERLVSAILEGREMHQDAERFSWQTWEDDEAEPDMRRMGRSPDEICNVKEFFMNERGSEMSQENDRPEPLLIGARSAASSVYSQCRDQEREKELDENVEVIGHVSTGLGSYDGATSSALTIHTHQDDTRSPSSVSGKEETDTKVEAWLARGFLPSTSPAVRHSRLHNKDVDRAFPTRKPALALFPPKSSLTGKLEYTPLNSPFARPVCPLSPLGNGRDAYGNYISTNTQDYFMTQSPPTSPVLQPMSKDHNSSTSTSLPAIPEGRASSTTDRSSPVVHLRGGGWIKPFWKTTDTGKGSQAPRSTTRYRASDKNGVVRDVPVVYYPGREGGRAAPSVRSQFSVLRSGRDARTTNRTHIIQSANAGERHNVGYRGEHVTSTDRPKTLDSANTDASSECKARVEKLFDHYGRHLVPPSLPISAGIRPITARDADTTYPDYSKRPLQPISHQRPVSGELWDSQNSASTICSYEGASRVEKRWNRDNRLPPPRAPPPVPPKDLPPRPLNASHDDEDDYSIYSEGSNHRPAPSIAMSATSANDPLRDLPGFQTSKTYRDYTYAREVARIEAQRRRNTEADRRLQEDRRRQLEVQSQEPDRSTIVSTIVPGDSISEMVQRQRLERLREVQLMKPVIEQRRPRSPAPPSIHVSRYVHTPFNSRPIQQPQNLSISRPSLAPAPVAYVQTGRPRKKSILKVASFAGKVSRFLLAAPSDSELKTYSRHCPPVEESGQASMSADRNGWTHVNVAPHEMIAPPPATGWRERRRNKDKPQHSRHHKARDSPIGMRAGNLRTGIFGKTKGKGKGKGRTVEEIQNTNTQARDFASRDTRRAELPSTPIVNTNAYGTGLTKAANLGYSRSGSTPQPQQAVHKETVAGPSEPRYQTPRVPGEILPHDEQLGYPAHWRLMEFYGHGDQARITGQWVDRVTNMVNDERIALRGGAGSEPNSLAAHHFLLPQGVFDKGDDRHEANGGRYDDIDALLMSSTHLGLDEATVEALAGAEANMRSSFSTDSTVEEMREKRRKENMWRQEDSARALALAMSF